MFSRGRYPPISDIVRYHLAKYVTRECESSPQNCTVQRDSAATTLLKNVIGGPSRVAQWLTGEPHPPVSRAMHVALPQRHECLGHW